ncbi:MAG TPA: DUF4142 domain-containing protein [Rudaea sp.]
MPAAAPAKSILIVALLAVTSAYAQQSYRLDQASATGKDSAFVQQAAKAGLAEVELSRVAAGSAASPEVRQFADDMIRDHTKNNEDLGAIARAENLRVPDTLDNEHAELRTRLQTLKGTPFDEAYMTAMRQDHQAVADLLRGSQSQVSSIALRNYIRSTLPVVEHHLEMARKIKTR